MCLEAKTKQNSIQCVSYYLASKLKSMWPCENPQKRCIVLQNGRQNKVVVIMNAAVLTEHAVAVKIHAVMVKKEAWQKSIAGTQP